MHFHIREKAFHLAFHLAIVIMAMRFEIFPARFLAVMVAIEHVKMTFSVKLRHQAKLLIVCLHNLS